MTTEPGTNLCLYQNIIVGVKAPSQYQINCSVFNGLNKSCSRQWTLLSVFRERDLLSQHQPELFGDPYGTVLANSSTECNPESPLDVMPHHKIMPVPDSVSSITRSHHQGHPHRFQEIFTALDFHIALQMLSIPAVSPPTPCSYLFIPSGELSSSCLYSSQIHPQYLLCFPYSLK